MLNVAVNYHVVRDKFAFITVFTLIVIESRLISTLSISGAEIINPKSYFRVFCLTYILIMVDS